MEMSSQTMENIHKKDFNGYGGSPMIKIMIKRKVPKGREEELMNLIVALRSRASKQPGYISGETLRSKAEPDTYLVISIWDDEKYWKTWLASEERAEYQNRIDELTGTETEYEIYHYPTKVSIP
jgi:heme-degrading monooxygenase HmoA